MAVSASWYGNAMIKAFNKEIDWDSDTIKVCLLKDTYTPNQDTHDYYDDLVIASNEVSGAGYTTGGETLTNKTLTYDAGTNTIKFDGYDVVWTASTITDARYAVIYDDTPATAATKPLLGIVDFGENKSSSAGNFTIQWNTDGILKAVVG